MRITDIRELTVPLEGNIANAVVNFAEHTVSMVAVVSDVIRNGKRFVKAEDARFLAQTVDAIWARVERSRWRSDAQRERFRAAVDSAKAVYARLAP